MPNSTNNSHCWFLCINNFISLLEARTWNVFPVSYHIEAGFLNCGCITGSYTGLWAHPLVTASLGGGVWLMAVGGSLPGSVYFCLDSAILFCFLDFHTAFIQGRPFRHIVSVTEPANLILKLLKLSVKRNSYLL